MFNSIYRVGIAGYGIVGNRRHISIKKIKKMKVVAICDKNFLKKRTALQNGIIKYNNYIDLINHGLDILIVCMTNDIAPKVVSKAIKSNLHVFCEKPPGKNLSDIYKIIKLKNNYKNSKLMYGFNHRFHDSVIDAKKIIDSKKFGKIINLRGIYGKSKIINFDQTDWRTKRNQAGGGILLDQGIHIIDLIRYFAGNFNEVKSFISNKYWKFDVEDNAYAILKSKKGIYATVNSSATMWKHSFNLEINFEKGSVVLSGLITSSKSYGNEKLIILKKNKKNGFNEKTIKYNNDYSWSREMNIFMHSVIKNKVINNGNCKDAFETMKLVYQIYYSDKKWRNKFKIPDPNKINI